jgi:intracellular multiplication protein IcmC
MNEVYFPYLYRLATGFTFILGLAFALRGLFLLKEYGAMRTMMSSQTHIGPPLVNMGIGLALLYWKVVLDAFLITMYGTSTLESAPLGFSELEIKLSILLRLFGFIAFVRGWVLLARAASHAAQPGSISKGVMYIISGVMLVNIFATWNLLYSFFKGFV